MEAQSQRLACVATQLPGISELIEDGRTGVLVAPGNPRALAAAIESLIRDLARRSRLGAAGEERVRRGGGGGGGVCPRAPRVWFAGPPPAPAAPARRWNAPPPGPPTRMRL